MIRKENNMKKKIFKRFWALLLVALILMPVSNFTNIRADAATETTKEAIETTNDNVQSTMEQHDTDQVGDSESNDDPVLMIDVSSNNGEVNWDVVAEYVDRVCIRLGYGSDETRQDDKQFYRNVAECERLGIPYDIYLYSYALDETDSHSEADHAIRMARQCNPDYVWYDMEDADNYKRVKHGFDIYDADNRAELTQFCINFMDDVSAAGYNTGVYASRNYYTSVLFNNELEQNPHFNRWLAHWGIDDPSMPCLCWQFGAYEIDGYEYDGDLWYGADNVPDRTPTIETYDEETDDQVNVYCRVKVDGEWQDTVCNDETYNGIYGHAITDVALWVDQGYAEYRVHTNGRWLSWIDSDNTDISDYYNGYAGAGTPIDAIQIYYHTPNALRNHSGAQWSCYRTSSVNKTDGYYSSQWDTSTDSGMDGYAGVFGKHIDALVPFVTFRDAA